jgi:pimeloyl-ACP methyl ester carboxylesterase
VYGDLKTAQNILVMVPGTDTTARNFAGLDSDAGRVKEQAGSSTAVVAWLGYDAPEIPGGLLTDGRADAGAPRLADFVKAFGGGRRVSISGHSYGSLVAAKSVADQGARPGNLIFLGSPGVLQDSAAAFSPSRVWVGLADGDPVPSLAGDWIHGPRPHLRSFGALRFQTGTASGHNRYYQSGTESLSNIVRVVRGEYCDVTLVHAPVGWAIGCAVGRAFG